MTPREHGDFHTVAPASGKDIIAYVLKKYGVRVFNSEIANVRRQCGLYVQATVPRRKPSTSRRRWSTDDNPHRLGVEYAMSPEGRKLRNVGLTYGELFEHLSPELLAPLGMQIVWPDREAVHLADDRQIVSCYEIQSHLEARARKRQRECQREKRVKETAERYARKLEHLKASAHPAISTWAPDVIVSRAISWAYQFVRNHSLV